MQVSGSSPDDDDVEIKKSTGADVAYIADVMLQCKLRPTASLSSGF